MSTAVVPSIDQLQELPLGTPPFSYAPQTWGWWVLLALLLTAVAGWVAWRWWRWQRDRYRREALAQFDELTQQLADPQLRLQALRAVPALLKRVALSMTDAPPVAALGGAQWQAFLLQRARTPLPEQFGAQLQTLAYAPQAQVLNIPEQELRLLLAHSRQWIETHHVAV
ncbi:MULTISPECIES: DUF4381 domain-containing protein [Pseudomonas]|uniref:DUF4381 domain-containing protein n=1 Tax=Pseudomonas auratipiscis TaxID=3115853 RepID=A0AB35WPQ6_9PSED|nr:MULTISPECIES: DUF4381 domain-containing protein [Pseudomonas]MBM3104256.1 DUF4381 domain-containing protein [Pseudomonas arcuscaelestis]MEE1865100.1 DUF4381 domain-containing protein [Pseudomonas sp. 120P]MEE1955959.1 DUF4381 domain-containing protein [Pseudomonas sp. 119P]